MRPAYDLAKAGTWRSKPGEWQTLCRTVPGTPSRYGSDRRCKAEVSIDGIMGRTPTISKPNRKWFAFRDLAS